VGSSGELLRYPVELAQQFVWTANADGSLRSISPQYYELTGLKAEAHPAEAIHPDDREMILDAWRAAVSSGTVHLVDYRLRLACGDYRRFRSRATPRRNQQGRILRWYGTVENVHTEVEAQDARLAAEERFRLAARATNDAIWDLDIAAGTIAWADTAQSLFGYDSGSRATALSWWDERVHPDDRDRVIATLDGRIAGDATHWAEEYRFRCADGSYADVLDRGYIVRDPGGRAIRIVGAMSDVTERRRAEAELQRMQAELIHVSRLSAMGEMASTLAHELNQPLTAISAYLRGVRVRLKDVEHDAVRQVQAALESAEAGALRAGDIVRRLRELVARRSAAAQAEELPELIADACMLALVDADLLGIHHEIETDRKARWVLADRIQVQQVLINLIRNAVQAMSERADKRLAIRTALRPDGLVEISVGDSGTGIAQEQFETLFSPFHSSKPDGLGIGLSISRTIVESHGGKIWAENQPEGGALFRFTLPRAERPRGGR
jgi:PAS domain S-box-containing protein